MRVSEALHQKMKEQSLKSGRNIREEYEVAIKNHLKNAAEKEIIMDSELEEYINKRIEKAENHITSMLGRTGMDTSMNLMGVLILLEKLLKVDRKTIQDELRVQGAKYFSTAIKSDKNEKNKKID